MNTKYLLLLAFLATGTLRLAAQGVNCPNAVAGNNILGWIEPAEPDVNDSVYIYVDVTQDPNCNILVGSTADLYIWTWGPTEPQSKIGTWSNSAETAKMERVSDNIYRFGMIPTEFYGVDADKVYENGICFLAKKKDGGTGGDCKAGGGDNKTTDIHIKVPSPFAKARKVYSFPDVVAEDTLLSRTDDVFTLFYDKRLEEIPKLIAADNFWVYLRVIGTDNKTYNYKALNALTQDPRLQMTDTDGDGVYSFSMIPSDFVKSVLPANVQPARLRIQIVTLPLCGTDCAVEGNFFYTFKCQN